LGYYDVSGYGDHGSLTINSSRYPSNVRAVAALPCAAPGGVENFNAQRRNVKRDAQPQRRSLAELFLRRSRARIPLIVSVSRWASHGQSLLHAPRCFDGFESFEDVAVSGDCQNGLTQCKQAMLPHSGGLVHGLSRARAPNAKSVARRQSAWHVVKA